MMNLDPLVLLSMIAVELIVGLGTTLYISLRGRELRLRDAAIFVTAAVVLVSVTKLFTSLHRDVALAISHLPFVMLKAMKRWPALIPLAQAMLGWMAGLVISEDYLLRATLAEKFPFLPNLNRTLEHICIVLGVAIVLVGRKLVRLKSGSEPA